MRRERQNGGRIIVAKRLNFFRRGAGAKSFRSSCRGRELGTEAARKRGGAQSAMLFAPVPRAGPASVQVRGAVASAPGRGASESTADAHKGKCRICRSQPASAPPKPSAEQPSA